MEGFIMKISKKIKYSLLVVILLSMFFISVGRCQDEDEDDEEDTYDEELGDTESTTTRRSRPRRTTTNTPTPASVRGNDTRINGSSTVRSGVEASTRVSVQTPASAPVPPTRATVRTTTLSEYEDDEVTTEEEGYGYVFRPLNNLIDNIVAGNVTGIVDNALSIRTPPEIRQFVNNVMANVFGSGIGNALKQFMPNLFSTQAPLTTLRPGRDPIPTQSSALQGVIVKPIPEVETVITSRNASDEVKSTKSQQQPIQLAFAHPGAPASRLRCEVIM